MHLCETWEILFKNDFEKAVITDGHYALNTVQHHRHVYGRLLEINNVYNTQWKHGQRTVFLSGMGNEKYPIFVV